MIIVRSPLRITLGGVGTDLPSYYRDHGGFLVTAAIDKYVCISIARTVIPGIVVRHSDVEHATSIDGIKHPIIREALRMFWSTTPQMEITTFSDVPSGTGLGSSGSFTTAFVRGLHALRRTDVTKRELAEQACNIEIDLLGEPIGKQDQYAAALGGLTSLTFAKDGSVDIEPLVLDEAIRRHLEDNILLFFTGATRSASNILRDQVARLNAKDRAMIDSLNFEVENAFQSREAIQQGDLPRYGLLLSKHWDMKRKRSQAISSAAIDRWYNLGLENGAFGGKLVGAGGGGFLLFCASDKSKLREAMRAQGLVEMNFGFDHDGTRVLMQ